jgi:hypothetical protein
MGPRSLPPHRVDGILPPEVRPRGLVWGEASHARRTTRFATALDNGAKLEDVQRTVGHVDPATTQLYDRRRFFPTQSAALMVAH